MIARGDAARDSGHYRDAAVLYKEALRIAPDNAAIHVQCGHMFKESGNLASAESHYLDASRLTPGDPDLALQLGHFYKVAGRLRESAAAYERAIELRPDWDVPATELANLHRTGWRGKAKQVAAGQADALDRDVQPHRSHGFSEEAAELQLAGAIDRLVPEIVPRKPHEMLHPHHDSINLRRFGQRERTYWGMLPAFRGVEAIRGFCISSVPILELQITLNGSVISRSPLRGGYTLQYEKENKNLRKYVFNIWHDFSDYAWGRHEIELRFVDANWGTRTHREHIVVAAPLSELHHPDSDAVISLPDSDARSAEEQINSRPSVVRPAKRALFSEPIRNVLIIRTDQLGDMVTSIPAMRRLRELLPDSHLVGLLTSSNAEFAATLEVFDEIIVIDFPDDRLDRRRTMPLQTQEQLRARLEPYRFELAVDLAESSMSRPLLLLSGASFLYGFYDRDWPWLSAGFEGNSHDPKNRAEVAPHSTRVLAFVERLGAMLKSKAEVIRRTDLSREGLARYGISETDRFVILHGGARIEFSRWPYYCELASLILQKTDLKVILLTDDPMAREGLTPNLINSERFLLLEQRLSFDDFDALLSFCSAFVGNDSGPKHLASLRGANVVSIHSARVNWNEWGQEMVGSIISRKVPCAGCMIYHDADECGKDFACIVNISPEEVFDALMQLL